MQHCSVAISISQVFSVLQLLDLDIRMLHNKPVTHLHTRFEAVVLPGNGN